MIWITLSITLYLLTCGIALFLICSGDKERGPDAYYDVRNIGVSVIWPMVLLGYGMWLIGKKIFTEKTKETDADDQN